jgi:hypothetical protein
LENLTSHPMSIRDDVLNTRYFSHYNQDYGKKEVPDEKAEAISKIESHLDELKGKAMMLMMQNGKNPGIMEELHEQTRLEGITAFEKFVAEKKRYESKELIIEAYENVLLEKR